MIQAITLKRRQISSEQIFMLTMFIVNAGNYAYNLLLGRMLGPNAFADAAILITFLLVLSFVGMTFQIVTTKYSVLLEGDLKNKFIKTISKISIAIGISIGLLFIIFSENLQILLHTETDTMFHLFGIGIPLYFLMSVNRGIYQGENKLNLLSITYVSEMFARLFITITLFFFASKLPTTILVATGIAISFVFGLIPFQKTIFKKATFENKIKVETKPIVTFFALTAFYELTQIIINNSDVILVKHFFDNQQAGFYASLALIGRVVYFVTWIFVMLLLPKVIQLKKEGKNTQPILMKYVSIIALFSAIIVLVTYIMPETVVYLMFGDDYLSIAPLLWQYALATAIFAVANVFAYYFLSISNYFPVIISALLGCTQIVLIVFFHNSLEQVVHMQTVAMLILLVFQLLYFVYQNKKSIRLQ
ncbi:oligosaccharide flippase family protein [Flavobacterium jejuense]|uniref:Oligosaccharide flippase family protein n=1 Tax=Flavobacterium jejuense TaxID=1544455 RepID=A0ABX0IUW0_9FLAO|nr:oligosaccharide flippase family protein [Flavobacterium jejuense]NHN26614.1 oligosaccharide flippase family protein [Flavobacterium jejuense]